MRKVGGYVLAKESHIGVPNLVVALFDSELALEDVRGQDWSAALARRAGRRISSVLTDASGRFSLEAEELEFAGNEPRPDLLLMVLAPEDVDDPARPYPAPVEARTLYVSSIPRVSAGAEEAYVIRLLQRRLQAAGIPMGPGRRDPENAATELTDVTLAALELRHHVRSQLEGPRAEARRLEQEGREEARRKLEGFSGIPRHLRQKVRKGPDLWIASRAELAENLKPLQEAAVQDGLERMKARPRRPTMKLYLTEAEVQALKLKVKGDTVSGALAAKDLRATVGGLMDLTDLIRKRGFEPPDLEALERRYLSGEAEAPPPPEPIG